MAEIFPSLYKNITKKKNPANNNAMSVLHMRINPIVFIKILFKEQENRR